MQRPLAAAATAMLLAMQFLMTETLALGTYVPHTSLVMLVPLLSVFLGLLFGMRYHSAVASFDSALKEAGEPGLTPEQTKWLTTVRLSVFGGIGAFLLPLVAYLFFGLGPHGGSAPLFIAACVGHAIMSLLLLAASVADMRSQVARPWLRFAVLVLGLAGTVGAPVAALTLSPNLLAG